MPTQKELLKYRRKSNQYVDFHRLPNGNLLITANRDCRKDLRILRKDNLKQGFDPFRVDDEHEVLSDAIHSMGWEWADDTVTLWGGPVIAEWGPTRRMTERELSYFYGYAGGPSKHPISTMSYSLVRVYTDQDGPGTTVTKGDDPVALWKLAADEVMGIYRLVASADENREMSNGEHICDENVEEAKDIVEHYDSSPAVWDETDLRRLRVSCKDEYFVREWNEDHFEVNISDPTRTNYGGKLTFAVVEDR